MKRPKSLSVFAFWTGWTFLTITGLLLALLASIMIYVIFGVIVVELGPLEMILSPIYVLASPAAIFFIFGGVLGYCQWISLDRRNMPLRNWLVANGLGWILAIFILVYMSAFEVPGVPLLGFMLGPIIGFMQWFVMRAWNKRAMWWIGINALGYGLAAYIVLGDQTSLLGQTGMNYSHSPGLLLIAGGVVGAITGLGLVWPIKWQSGENPDPM